MDLYKNVENKLKELSIEYEEVNHPPARTTEEADKFIEGINGVRTKTMFLTNKKKTEFYLLIMDDSKKLNMDIFKEIVRANRIKMASEESLYEQMLLQSGIVSPFGLLNKDNNIKVYIDKEIMSEERMSFHPNTNEKTIFIHRDDLIKFLNNIGHEANIIEI